MTSTSCIKCYLELLKDLDVILTVSVALSLDQTIVHFLVQGGPPHGLGQAQLRVSFKLVQDVPGSHQQGVLWHPGVEHGGEEICQKNNQSLERRLTHTQERI